MTKPTFKMTKFHFRGQREAEALQLAMFTLGFCWLDKVPGAVRKLNKHLPTNGFLYVNDDCRIMYSDENYGFSATTSDYASTFAVTLFLAAEAHKKAKQVERKASRKRAALRRQGWIINTGTQPNVEGDVEVLFHSGETRTAYDADVWYWGNEGASWHIKAYRPVSKPVAQIVDADGFIAWDGTGYQATNEEFRPGNMSGPVMHGTVVDIKFRGGEVELNVPAGKLVGRAAGAYWKNDNSKNDIIAYRLAVVAAPAEAIPVAEPAQVQPDTNPKRQYGVSSVPLNMWSQLASAYGALALYNGALKYGKANFANTPVEASIYVAAAQRHLAAWAAGEEFDPADGVPNLGGVLANIAILLESRAAGMLIDDRLKMDGYLKERDALKDIVKSLNVLHAGKTPKHYTLGAN